ncbi:Biopolymer transport protein ExbD/TolR [Candidatus Sulfotelmatomonas gaucii]|uniref:Biopolymer transport protein ExbD/TolR n=1 Tax=Candidatus Sulfuritelmatomonas gaucii TaxID=2043161 RepID=A0A2N9LCE5_9BACT|nr:Biopolymer transport protein ExbD/TolR [Candidatus Sulfotelmatomonas gaucii]
MAMSMGSAGGNMSEINVTPMIDILLVLLIIFMVIVPTVPHGLEALVPQPPKNPQQQQQQDRTIVVQVLYRGGQAPAYKINETDVAHGELLARLTEIYANRAERVMFVKGDDNVNFASIADVIDIAKSANVDHIGLMTPKIQQGQ